MTTSEGQFTTGDATLYTKTWTPAGPIKAKVIFVHGFSEHINRYNDFFPRLTAHGIQILSWDQRGWGRSVTHPSQRGLTGPTTQVLSDMTAFITQHLPSPSPVFLMGHSMGGGQVLTLACSPDPDHAALTSQLRGIILESPFVGFTPGSEPSRVKVLLGRLAARVLPRRQLAHAVPPEHLSRRAEVIESFREDALCHNTGTLEGLAGLLDRTAALRGGPGEGMKLNEGVRSVLLAHGTSDLQCSHDDAMGFLKGQTVGDKVGRSYEGAYHQLHADLCEEEYAADLVGWILERCGEGETGRIEAKL